MAETKTFEFKQCVNLLKSTGKKARSLKDLRDVIASVSRESIFHHTYQYFLKGHMLQYTNDFAHWAGESLEERALAEQLSNIDPYSFTDLDELRNELLRVIDAYISGFPEPRDVLPGEEFYCNETITITCPLGVRVRNLAEFLMAIKYIDEGSLYYHFYEARVRLGMDDFSKWIEEVLERPEPAERIRAIDPFMHSIDGIRDHIAAAVEHTLREDMNAVG